MAEYKNILYEKKEGISYITINRPQVLNALNYATRDELEEAYKQIKDDPEIKVVIITGAGEKSFVSGADIQELLKDHTLQERKEIMLQAHQVFRGIENLGKPTIAAINGYCLGGGLELAMACTLRVAAEGARFGQPEINLGLIPGYGGTQRLPRLIGKGRALELILTGEMINAEEAWRIGLVNKVVSLPELMPTCEELARKIASKGPIAIKSALEAVNRGLKMSLDDALQCEADLMAALFTTENAKEGLAAFLEKRKPTFKGK